MNTGTLEYYLSLDYPVEIRRIPEELGSGYSASIPHLGRMAFFAAGDTIEEALHELEEIKANLFAYMIESKNKIQLPPPLPEEESEVYSGRILLRLPRDLHRDLAMMAEENGCSINQYAAVALAKQISGESCAKITAIQAIERYVMVIDSKTESCSYNLDFEQKQSTITNSKYVSFGKPNYFSTA